MSYFMSTPSKMLATMEDVRAAIQDPALKTRSAGLDAYSIKSDWLISLIDEIVAQSKDRFAYNAQVKRLAAERLGLPGCTEEYYHSEGDALSLLVYNAQNYRRSDELRKQGFEPMTPALIERAFAGSQKIEVLNDNVFGSSALQLTVKKVGEKLYAMPPRKRKQYIQPIGQPAKLI